MIHKGWYLVVYDIANKKRLAKVHRFLKKQGIAAQKSVFFVLGTEKQIDGLLDRIAKVMMLKEDDLRAYPVTNPKDVWTSGPNPLGDIPIVYAAS